ncbi:Uncharacterized protein Rs2_46017 [Raphanus sativus]|nr:Uncharacterized protein Rs2_46017 [Raphanus sativus]
MWEKSDEFLRAFLFLFNTKRRRRTKQKAERSNRISPAIEEDCGGDGEYDNDARKFYQRLRGQIQVQGAGDHQTIQFSVNVWRPRPWNRQGLQVEDTMRLLGVVKVTSSRLGISGTGGSIVEELSAQMRMVSKIALTYKPTFSFFLEMKVQTRFCFVYPCIRFLTVVDNLMQVLWGILDTEPLDTPTMNIIVMSSVELIYSYAECLASQGKDKGVHSVAPAVQLLKALILSPNESVQTSSRFLCQSKTMLTTDELVYNVTTPPAPSRTAGGNTHVIMIEEDSITSSVQYCCDGCSTVHILRRRWYLNTSLLTAVPLFLYSDFVARWFCLKGVLLQGRFESNLYQHRFEENVEVVLLEEALPGIRDLFNAARKSSPSILFIHLLCVQIDIYDVKVKKRIFRRYLLSQCNALDAVDRFTDNHGICSNCHQNAYQCRQ